MDGEQPYDGEDRRARERAFHREFAQRHAAKIDEPVPLDVVEDSTRRPWNAYWSAYDALRALDIRGKSVLLPGCGFGEDAIRLAMMGALVHASDLSAELVEIAAMRARRAGASGIRFDVMPVERLDYPDETFDLVFYNDLLHHVDIPRALAEARRVVRRGGRAVVNELYTHSAVQKVRNSQMVTRHVYPRMVRMIYGTDRPYITADERKLDERELADLEALFDQPSVNYYLLFEGRVFPSRWPLASRIDRTVLRGLGPAGGRLLAGRFVLTGRFR